MTATATIRSTVETVNAGREFAAATSRKTATSARVAAAKRCAV